MQLYLSCPPPGGQKAAVEAAFCADVAEELQKSRSKIKEKTFFFGKYKNILKKEMKIIQVSVDFFNALQNYNKSSRSQNKVYFLIPVFILLLCYTAK